MIGVDPSDYVPHFRHYDVYGALGRQLRDEGVRIVYMFKNMADARARYEEFIKENPIGTDGWDNFILCAGYFARARAKEKIN